MKNLIAIAISAGLLIIPHDLLADGHDNFEDEPTAPSASSKRNVSLPDDAPFQRACNASINMRDWENSEVCGCAGQYTSAKPSGGVSAKDLAKNPHWVKQPDAYSYNDMVDLSKSGTMIEFDRATKLADGRWSCRAAFFGYIVGNCDLTLSWRGRFVPESNFNLRGTLRSHPGASASERTGKTRLPECANSPTTSKSIAGEWNNCIGTFGYPHAGFTGEWQNGLPERGILRGRGEKYSGQFKDDQIHGKGTYLYANGDKYVGEFEKSKPHGWGKYTWANGDEYEGELRFKKPDGKGTYLFRASGPYQGDKFIGVFKDGKIEGRGIWTKANGTIIEGQFRDVNLSGPATVYFSNGDTYSGEVQGNEINGFGTYMYKAPGPNKGDKYVGEFKDKKSHGFGTYYYASGDKYEGEFRENLLHGQGTYIWANGKKYVGQYRNDQKHGHGVFTQPDGSKYIGDYKNGAPDGLGIATYADGSVKEGVWEKGIFKRYEKVTLPNPKKTRKIGNETTANPQNYKSPPEKQVAIVERLKKLKKLEDAGLITKEEAGAKRKEILKNL